MKMRWPAEADMLIRTGWSWGVPVRHIAIAVEIAMASPRSITRNMIVGRAHRLHLPPHPHAAHRPADPLPPAAPAAQAVA